MSNVYVEHKDLELKDNGQTTKFDATVYYNNDKPCAVILTNSENNMGPKLSEVIDKAMLSTANAVMNTHEKQMQGGDKLYAYADNGNGTFKQQPFELHDKGSMQDRSASERSMSPYRQDTGTDHKPLDSVHKDRMENTISELQGRNVLAENKMPSIDRVFEQNQKR